MRKREWFEISRRDEKSKNNEGNIRQKEELSVLYKISALTFYALVIGEYKLVFYLLTDNGKEGNTDRNFIPCKIKIISQKTQLFMIVRANCISSL